MSEPQVELQFIGSAETVTGSRILLSFRGHKYLIDCGLFQGPKEIRQQNWDDFPLAPEIRTVILTHAHIDHSGYLPRLYRQGFRGEVHCSKATHALCDIMLMDSAHLQEEDARYANKTKHSRHDPALPLYGTHEAQSVLKLFRSKPLNDWIPLEKDLSYRLIRSGHILGSTFIQVNVAHENGSFRVTFSGDLGNGRSNVIKPPEVIRETEYLVMESTYGDRSQPHVDTEAALQEVIEKVYGRGGTLVIPAFTVGRTQEILYLIGRLKERGRIPNEIPVYLDSPMALDATQLYMGFPDELKFSLSGEEAPLPVCPSHYRPVKSADDSMLLCMSTEPKIVISAAGMLTGGRILHHLKSKLDDPKSAVLFVGYQVEGTKGLLLKNGLTKIRIHHEDIFVEAEILSIDSFSAHGDSDEIIEWIQNIENPPQMIILNHGEPNALRTLAYRVKHEVGSPVIVAKTSEKYVLNKKEAKTIHID